MDGVNVDGVNVDSVNVDGGGPQLQTEDDLIVRELQEADVEVIESSEPPGKGFVRAMWALQGQGRSLLLVAWRDGRRVGSGEIDWTHRPPELKNLAVDSDQRGRGVGTALIREAERRAHQHGELCVGVGLDNPRARALYERLGYRGTGEISTTTYEYVDADGARRTATETDELLMRRWAGAATPP